MAKVDLTVEVGRCKDKRAGSGRDVCCYKSDSALRERDV